MGGLEDPRNLVPEVWLWLKLWQNYRVRCVFISVSSASDLLVSD